MKHIKRTARRHARRYAKRYLVGAVGASLLTGGTIALPDGALTALLLFL